MTGKTLPPSFCRLYDAGTGRDLVLDGSSVRILIADVHASAMISQRSTNTINTTLSAFYTFGTMSDVTICGFEMIRQDTTRVEGIVQEDDEEYETAIRDGRMATLGQQCFFISVGNIQARETVTINLRYLQPLVVDEKKNQIKFIFPRTYAQRYGQEWTHPARISLDHILSWDLPALVQRRLAQHPFTMNVIVQQIGAIKSISCPSGHSISFEMGLLADEITPLSNTTTHFASVSLADSSGFLTQDVVLVVTTEGLDSPRCLAEPHPSPDHETTAMALTFIPRLTLPVIKGGMEYIFVVDRSGSMAGQNMKLVQESLVVLLRSLPSSGTFFNIVSFGSRVTKLWDASYQYSQTSLEEATDHVE